MPTPSTNNTINSVSQNLRDFLLHKNLGPTYPFLMNQIPSPRIGEPVLDTLVNNGSNVIPFGLPLETEGILRMDIALLPNKIS